MLRESAIAAIRAMGREPRPYQREFVESAIRQSETAPAMVVSATGTGKSLMLLLYVLHYAGQGKPVLQVATGDEIIDQLCDLYRAAGLWVFREQAAQKPYRAQVMACATQRPTVVVASAPTMRGARLKRWKPEDFAAVTWDEGHHSQAPTWRAIYEWLQAPMAAFTATPWAKGLGDLWTVCATMTLPEAVQQGWLVPPRWVSIPLETCDLRALRKTAGDLNERDLADAVEKAMPEVLRQYVAHVDAAAPSINFWPSVVASRKAAAWLSAAAGIPSAHIDGTTPRGDGDDERRGILRRFSAGELSALHNCGVLTEGFDAPRAAVIGGMRPTLSMTLYLQMIGRGSRPVPGLLDTPELRDASPEARRAAIAASAKPHCTILDYQGNGARFDFCGPVQLLGGDLAPAVAKRAAEKYASGGTWDEAVRQALSDEERAQEEARRLEVRAAAIAATKEAAEKRAQERRQRLQDAAVNKAHVVDYLAGDVSFVPARNPLRVPERRCSEQQRKLLYLLCKRREKETETWTPQQSSRVWRRSEELSMDEARAAIGAFAATLCGADDIAEHLRKGVHTGVNTTVAERIARTVGYVEGMQPPQIRDLVTALKACDYRWALDLERLYQRKAG